MSKIALEKKITRSNLAKQDSKKHGSDENRSVLQDRLPETAKESLNYHGMFHRETLIENTYRLAPDPIHKFYGDVVDKIVSNLLSRELEEAVYSSEFAQKMSMILSRKIMEEVKSMKLKRYKLVAIVNIGNSNEKPTIHIFSRSLWNSDSDSYSSVLFSNSSLYAVAMVFAVYLE